VYLTSDGGETWVQAPQRLNARIPFYNTMEFADEQYGWFASSNYYDRGDASIFRTVDGGVTWEEKSAGTGIGFVSDIAFVDPLKGWLIDDVSQRVRRTVSGGSRWISAFYPMAGERLVGLYADPVSRVLWVLSDQHAWVSKDEGASWKKTMLIPAGSMLGCAFADSLGGWAVTRTGIVQKQIADPLATSARPLAAAADLALGAAWPNPVHAAADGVMIPFTVARAGQVTLTLHNTQGKQIAVLLERSIESGEHVTSWNPAGFSNGVYFLTLRSGVTAVTRRIVVAR
jgi:photosystem II stability/assembly factor-like uncharacterized protein